MLEEQEAALKQIMDYVKERQADAVLLSGDLYDRSVPPAAAVTMFDAFLTGLSEMGVTWRADRICQPDSGKEGALSGGKAGSPGTVRGYP